MDDGYVDEVMAHGAMQDMAPLVGASWHDALAAASVELAKLVVRFRENLTPDERATLTALGGALIRADRELDAQSVPWETRLDVDATASESRPGSTTADSVIVTLADDDGTVTVEYFFATGEMVVTDTRPQQPAVDQPSTPPSS